MALVKLHLAIASRRPDNGFITTGWIINGWTAQPAYKGVRS